MKIFDYHKELGEYVIFKHASRESLRSNIFDEDISLVSFSHDEEICSPETEDTRVGIILSGLAQVFSADGSKKVVLKTLTPGASFGFSNLYTSSPFPTRICAKKSCEVLFVSGDAVRRLIENDKDVMRAFMRLLCTKIEYLNKRITSFTAGSAERRLALFLANSACDGVCSLQIPMSALAETLDIGRASLYRAFDKLEGDGAIRREEKLVIIKNEKLLFEKYLDDPANNK